MLQIKNHRLRKRSISFGKMGVLERVFLSTILAYTVVGGMLGAYPRPLTGSHPFAARKPVELQAALLPSVISVKTSG